MNWYLSLNYMTPPPQKRKFSLYAIYMQFCIQSDLHAKRILQVPVIVCILYAFDMQKCIQRPAYQMNTKVPCNSYVHTKCISNAYDFRMHLWYG